MSERDHPEIRNKLRDLSARIDACEREFKEQGRLTEARQALLKDIKQRRDRAENKLASAQENGKAWDIIKSGVERDAVVLFDALRKAVEEMDSEESRSARTK
jgi:chromosome segregation ATPase